MNIQDEQPLIQANTDGSGPYTVTMRRAVHLASMLDTLLRPRRGLLVKGHLEQDFADRGELYEQKHQ